jgi:MFS transporter, ACS family, hexuronate transporter
MEAGLPADSQTVEPVTYTVVPASPPWHSSVRWWICGLLFFATTINYLDRQTLAVMKPHLETILHWTEADFGWMNFAFTLAYAIGFVLAGRFIDYVGIRRGFAIAVVVWSLAAMAHALVPYASAAFTAGTVFAGTAVWFAIARFFLGIGESANFPASIKAVARWFPQRERAVAVGIFNAGSNVGIILALPAVWLAIKWHWQAVFIISGVLGLIWLVFWLWLYREPEEHPTLTAQERAFIEQDRPPAAPATARRVHWTELLRRRQVWPFLLGKFLTDPVWWFYLFWLSSYLKDVRKLTPSAVAWWLIIPYLAADVGSIGGGWISGRLIKKGWNVAPARYVAMGICAACMPCAIIAVLTDQFWLALTCISLATAGHQGWSANLFTTASDMFPTSLTGSVVGLGGTSGAIGGMFMALIVGLTLEWTGKNYLYIFFWAGTMHPLSLLLYFLIVRNRFDKVDDTPADRASRPVLIGAGLAAALAGLIGIIMTTSNWNYMVKVTKVSGAAGGVTAAVGVTLIGLLLLYAGLPKRHVAQT